MRNQLKSRFKFFKLILFLYGKVQEVFKVKKELIRSIKEKEVQLSKLKAHIDKSSVCSDLYNKVVLEKAILKKELQELGKSNLLKKIRSIFPRKKTLICDYFKN